MNLKVVFLLTLFFQLIACTTPYKGSKPNLMLKGELAKNELKKFILKENVGYFAFKNDLNHKRYTAKSMEPLVKLVSPAGFLNLEKRNKWYSWQLYILGLGIAGLIGGLLIDDKSTKEALFGTSLIGSISSIGISYYVSAISSKASLLYNEDLKKKLGFSVGISYDY